MIKLFLNKLKLLKKYFFYIYIRSFFKQQNIFFLKKLYIYNKYLNFLKMDTYNEYSYIYSELYAIISLERLKYSNLIFLNRIRNFFFNVTLAKHNFFFSVKMLPENKRRKNNIYFRTGIINCVFLSFLEFLTNKLILIFKKINKKFSSLLNIIFYNIAFFNKEAFKRNYLRIKFLKILNTINQNFLKGPKKPKKRKSFLKKRKNFK